MMIRLQLSLSGKNLKELPDVMLNYDLCDTILLDISHNQLSELCPTICDFLFLEELICNNNKIRRIPATVEQLHFIVIFDLSCNQLDLLPECVCELHSLKILLLSHNRLASLPNQISNLSALTLLDVSSNEIAHLTPNIGLISSLQSLNISKNSIEVLPEEVCQLRLHQLDCSGNRLERLPVGLRHMHCIESLNVADNPLLMPPYQVCQKGIWYIMKVLHLEALREQRQKGTLTDAELRRSFRRSFRHSVSAEYSFVPSDDDRRNTLISADSGYATIGGTADVTALQMAENTAEPQVGKARSIDEEGTDNVQIESWPSSATETHSLPKSTTSSPQRRISYHRAAGSGERPNAYYYHDLQSSGESGTLDRSTLSDGSKSISIDYPSRPPNIVKSVSDYFATKTTNESAPVAMVTTGCPLCNDNTCSRCSQVVINVDSELRNDQLYPLSQPNDSPVKQPVSYQSDHHLPPDDHAADFGTLTRKSNPLKISCSSDTLTNYPISLSNRVFQSVGNGHVVSEAEMSSPSAISKGPL